MGPYYINFNTLQLLMRPMGPCTPASVYHIAVPKLYLRLCNLASQDNSDPQIH